MSSMSASVKSSPRFFRIHLQIRNKSKYNEVWALLRLVPISLHHTVVAYLPGRLYNIKSSTETPRSIIKPHFVCEMQHNPSRPSLNARNLRMNSRRKVKCSEIVFMTHLELLCRQLWVQGLIAWQLSMFWSSGVLAFWNSEYVRASLKSSGLVIASWILHVVEQLTPLTKSAIGRRRPQSIWPITKQNTPLFPSARQRPESCC